MSFRISQIVLLLCAIGTASAYLPEVIKGKMENWIAGKSGNVTSSGCILGTQTGCATSVAQGLTDQIIAELNSMGYSFKSLDPTWIHCSGACSLQSGAADNLVSACKAKNDYITLNSAFRSSAQQYLLYTWYNKHICSIGLGMHLYCLLIICLLFIHNSCCSWNF